MINNGLKTNDGILRTTLGKRLLKVIRISPSQITGEKILCEGCKEITFNKVPTPIYLYIDYLDDNHKLTIDSKCSLEVNSSLIAIKNISEDSISEQEYEIWLWE